MPDEPQPDLRSNRVRTALLLTTFAFVFLAVGWSIFWLLAHGAAREELDAALAREATAGRLWSCNRMTSGGYPLSIEIDCEQPSLRTTLDGRPASLRAQRALIRAPLYTPRLVTIDLAGPAEVSIESLAVHVDWNWRTLQFSSRGLPDRLDRLSMVGEGAVIDVQLAGLALPLTKIGAYQSHLRRAVSAPGSPYTLLIAFAGIESAMLNSVTGSGDQATFAAFASTTQIDRIVAGSMPDRLERWRTSGGRVTVNLLSLVKGPLSIQAEGDVGLDQRRRIDGKLDARLQNAGAALVALGASLGLIQPNALAGALAGSLLGGKGGAETHIGLVFENGALSIGPLRGILELPPLY